MGLFRLPYELLCGVFIELFLLGKGGNAFGVLLMIMDLSFGLGVLALGTRGFCALGWGYICLCLFVLGGVAVSCQVFKALKLVPIVITGWSEVISL